MTQTVNILRVVIASPGDVSSERAMAASVMEELNHSICLDRGLRFEAARWETDTYPGFHADGPQGLIDSILRVEDSDVLIGIFWKRFGTPTKNAASGTEHEFRAALEAWKRTGRPNLMVYFNQRPFSPQSREETDQWGQVLDFRKSFPKEGLWWPYRGTADFEHLLRTHLTNFIRSRSPSQPARGNIFLAHSGLTELSDAYFKVQRSIIEQEIRAFVGRENVERCLSLFLAQYSKGYFIISGAPGQGKTALACNLVHKNNSPHHFVSRTGGRVDTRLILRSLLGQLHASLKVPTSLSESVPELAKTWEEMLKCAAGPSPLLVVIDGLDEVSDWEGGDLPYLPTDSLPEHVCMVVTTRPGDALERLKGLVANVPHTFYDLECLSAVEIRQMLSRLCPGLGEREMARIAESSEGVPLYVRAVADLLKTTKDLDLLTLPPSVEGFFRHATAAVRQPGHVELKELLTVLATSRTYLTLRQLSEITGIRERTLHDFGITKIRQFLREVDGAYCFYHASFHQYVTHELLYKNELCEGHSKIAHWLQEGLDSDSKLASLAYHLFESGAEMRLQEVIGLAFLQEKATRFGYAVLEDLDFLTKSFLKTGDPNSVERCVHMLELLGDMVGEQILRDATQTLQKKNRLPTSPSWLPAKRSESVFPGRNLFVGTIPAADVTADFFEITNRGGCIGMAIGDAPSTGLRSAFVAQFLRNLFQKLWQDQNRSGELGQLLERINSMIVPHPEFERVSMQCVELDCKRGLMSVVNAGHPHPVLYSKRRRACDILPIPGELLHDSQRQTRRFCNYEQYTCEISAGDILVMLSDGLTEAHRLDGNPYGYRFVRVVEANSERSVEEIGDAILLDWRAHPRNQGEVDDVTLVLFRVPDDPQPEPAALPQR